MTSVEQTYIPQTAVIWTASSKDDYGKATYDSPREISVEWPQSVSESQGNQDSKESASDEVVVNEELPIGTLFWLGSLSNLPQTPTAIYVSVGRKISPDIKGRNFRYTHSLSFYSENLP